jgi:hypothetical protein
MKMDRIRMPGGKRIASGWIRVAAAALAVAFLTTVVSALASGGGTKVCVPSKPGHTLVTPKTGGGCPHGSTLTELGAQGPQGTTGPQGAAGAQGATGAAGAQGATGPRGVTGVQGVTGDQGATGARGDAGEKGTTGEKGATGPAGTSSPLVFGPYQSADDRDSGECGGEWAKDTFTRTYMITPLAEGAEPHGPGGFDVTVMVRGTFTTIPGAKQPGDTPGCTATIQNEVTGKFYGEYVVHMPADAEFDPEATYNSENPSITGSTKEFVEAFFPGQTSLGDYAWQFHYRTPGGESWDNTDHGNTGNVEGAS